MPILQHYYTSFYDGKTSGFKMKAMTPSITKEIKGFIEGMMVYQSPIGMDVRDVDHHPKALRYMPYSPTLSILGCSQSNGRDESVPNEGGRWGNYFAHSLVMPIADAAVPPPITYWNSPFWVKRQSTPDTKLEALDISAIHVGITLKDIWKHLADQKDHKWIYYLLCAVIHRESISRPIILVDNVDQVARWIAAISYMLPSRLRPQLSFSTYSQTPYNSRFHITGVAPETPLRPEEYETYFILNANIKRISKIQDSAYAQYLCERFIPERYEREVIPFHQYIDLNPPSLTTIDEQLDMLPRYYQIVVAEQQKPLTPEKFAIIQPMLGRFIQTAKLSDADRIELERLSTVMLNSVLARSIPEALREYIRIVQRLAQDDPSPQIVAQQATVIIKLIIKDYTQEAEKLKAELLRIFGKIEFDQATQSLEYRDDLLRLVPGASANALLLFWDLLSAHLIPSQETQGLLIETLKQTCRPPQGNVPEDKKPLFHAMLRGIQDHEKAWLQLAVQQRQQLFEGGLLVFYLTLVKKFPFAEREAYRSIMRQALPDITMREYHHELNKQLQIEKTTALFDFLKDWMNPVVPIGMQGSWLYDSVMEANKHYNSLLELQQLVFPILLTNTFEKYRDNNKLLRVSLTPLTTFDITEEEKSVWHQFSNDPGVHPDLRDHMQLRLSLHTMPLTHANATIIMRHIQSGVFPSYQSLLDYFLPRHFLHSVAQSFKNHQEIFYAFYLFKNSAEVQAFWDSYMLTFRNMVLLKATNKDFSAKIFQFWYELPDGFHHDFPKAVSIFMERVPIVVASVQKQKNFQKASKALLDVIRKYTWFSHVYPYLHPRRQKFLGIF